MSAERKIPHSRSRRAGRPAAGNGRHWSFVIGHLQRQMAGNRDSGLGIRGATKLPKWRVSPKGWNVTALGNAQGCGAATPPCSSRSALKGRDGRNNPRGRRGDHPTYSMAVDLRPPQP